MMIDSIWVISMFLCLFILEKIIREEIFTFLLHRYVDSLKYHCDAELVMARVKLECDNSTFNVILSTGIAVVALFYSLAEEVIFYSKELMYVCVVFVWLGDIVNFYFKTVKLNVVKYILFIRGIRL